MVTTWLPSISLPQKGTKLSLVQDRYTPEGDHVTDQVWFIPLRIVSNEETTKNYKVTVVTGWYW